MMAFGNCFGKPVLTVGIGTDLQMIGRGAGQREGVELGDIALSPSVAKDVCRRRLP